MIVHFAYGSNMSRSLMRKRCPGAAALGVATTTPVLGDWFLTGPRVPWTPALTALEAQIAGRF